MKKQSQAQCVIDEVAVVINGIKDADIAALTTMIKTAGRIFVTGRGRSGLMMKALAMRLVHLGFTVHVVGEITAPAIGERDVLIVGCGSGRTATIRVEMEAAKKAGARIVLITAARNPAIAQFAGEIIILPIPVKTAQPMGTLFEQSLLLFSDVMIMQLMEELKIDQDNMKSRHTNLE